MRGCQFSAVISARFLPVPLIVHLNVTHDGGERQSVIELQAKPDLILWLCAIHRSVLPLPQHKGKACYRERALCSLLLSKDFKSSLVKRKKGSTMKSLPSV